MENNKLVTVLQENGVAEAEDVRKVFSPFFDGVEEVKEACLSIKIDSVEQAEAMAQAREFRLNLKKLRVAAEKEKNALKEQPLRKCQAIDAVFRYLVSEVKPLEEHLENQEKYALLKEESRKAELETKRKKLLDEVDGDYEFVDLKEMPEENFETYLLNATQNFKAKKEREAAEEAERERLAKEEAERQEAMRIENERLKKEAEEKEALLKEEREKAEAEKAEIEAQHQAKLDKERKEKEALEAELKKKKEEAEQKEKEERERIKADEEAKKRAEKAAQLAPDRAKLEQLATEITQIKLPEVKSEEAKQVLIAVVELLSKTSAYIKEKSLNL